MDQVISWHTWALPCVLGEVGPQENFPAGGKWALTSTLVRVPVGGHSVTETYPSCVPLPLGSTAAGGEGGGWCGLQGGWGGVPHGPLANIALPGSSSGGHFLDSVRCLGSGGGSGLAHQLVLHLHLSMATAWAIRR